MFSRAIVAGGLPSPLVLAVGLTYKSPKNSKRHISKHVKKTDVIIKVEKL